MAIRKILPISFFMVVLTVSFQNCAKKGPSLGGDEATSEQQIAQSKTVEILSTRCSDCHSGSAAYSNAPAGADPITDISNVDYLVRSRLVIPGEPDLSPLFQAIQNAEMPPGQPLSLAEVNTIKNWITDYNKQTTPTGTGLPAPTPLAATFTSLRVNVLLPKCNGCHINRVVKIDNLANVMAAITNNNLRGRVNNNTMPPPNAPALSPMEKNLLLQWIDAGTPNN